jgi:hypothetical protein
MDDSYLTDEQKELADLMSEHSQAAYRAGWMLGIERELWEAMHAPGFGGVPLNLTAADVQRLTALSACCGGWIVNDGVSPMRFVPLAEWEASLIERHVLHSRTRPMDAFLCAINGSPALRYDNIERRMKESRAKKKD